MNDRRKLLIFVKNPILYRVKTRLAQDVGAANALRIYRHLLAHTHRITAPLAVSKTVYYSDFIPASDMWDNTSYGKSLQKGADLGTRMSNAFYEGFNAGFTEIIIIGSDNPQLTEAIIEEAFLQLKTHDFVIGPAVDGGYYLLGMKTLDQSIFEDKQWSTSTILRDTLASIQKLGMNYYLLPELRDVDTVDDLGAMWDLIENVSEQDEDFYHHTNLQ